MVKASHACPICGGAVADPPSGHRSKKNAFPFCSERCKLVDLGRWLDGKYRVPIPDSALSEEGVDE